MNIFHIYIWADEILRWINVNLRYVKWLLHNVIEKTWQTHKCSYIHFSVWIFDFRKFFEMQPKMGSNRLPTHRMSAHGKLFPLSLLILKLEFWPYVPNFPAIQMPLLFVHVFANGWAKISSWGISMGQIII